MEGLFSIVQSMATLKSAIRASIRRIKIFMGG